VYGVPCTERTYDYDLRNCVYILMDHVDDAVDWSVESSRGHESHDPMDMDIWYDSHELRVLMSAQEIVDDLSSILRAY
jgi:hypothetical protein